VPNGKYFVKTAVACLVMTSVSSFSQDNNPFEFKPRQEVAVVQTAVQVDTRELSASQKEQVIALLTEFLSDASVNSSDSLFQIGDGKNYLVIPDEDKIVGKISGRYIIWDESRQKNTYHNSSKIDDVVTVTEYSKIAESQDEAMSKVGSKLVEGIQGIKQKASDLLPDAPKANAQGEIQLGKQAKVKK